MPQANRTRVNEIVGQILELPRDEWDEHLDRVCGSDGELRAVIDVILRDEVTSTGILPTPHPEAIVLTPGQLGTAPTREISDSGPRTESTRELSDSLDLEQQHMLGQLSQRLFGMSNEPVRMGRFIILDRLGKGGMGIVYSAYDPELDRKVALKLLREDTGSADLDARERLRREAQALAKLSHPNVVPVYDVVIIDERVVCGDGVRQGPDFA